MLDLTTRTASKKLYEIKYVDGTIYTLKLPTQALLMKLISLQKNINDPEVIFPALIELLVDIMNLNTQGKKFTQEQISKDLDLDTSILVIKDYLTYTTTTLGE